MGEKAGEETNSAILNQEHYQTVLVGQFFQQTEHGTGTMNANGRPAPVVEEKRFS